MERLFDRYFWTVWLVFLALSALLAARTVNALVATALAPLPDLGLNDAPRGAWVPPPVEVPLDTARFGHLFGIEPPPPPDPAIEAEKQEAENTTVCFTCAPVKTNLRLQLLATMVANEPRWSMALIQDLDKQDSSYYFIGDPIKDATVFGIQRSPQRVIIVNHDTHRLEYIDDVPGPGELASAGNLGVSPMIGAPPYRQVYSPGLTGVTNVGGNNYDITRNRLNSTLADLNQVATQARIVPSFQNGAANGFRLFDIQPGSIYSAIGIQNGDVVTRINGYDINSPEKALEIYERLKDSQNVDLQVERNGQLVNYHYSIQ